MFDFKILFLDFIKGVALNAQTNADNEKYQLPDNDTKNLSST